MSSTPKLSAGSGLRLGPCLGFFPCLSCFSYCLTGFSQKYFLKDHLYRMCFLSQVIGQCHCWPSWHLVMPWGNSLNEIYIQYYAYYLHKSKARCYGNSIEVFTVPLSFENTTTVVVLNSALGIPWTDNNIGQVYSWILNVGVWGRE